MDEKIKMVILAIVIALSGIMVSVLFEASGIRELNPLSFDMLGEITFLATDLVFLALLFVAPLPFAVTALASFYFDEKKNAYLTGLAGAGVAIGFHLFFIAFSTEEMLLSFFVLLSAILIIESVYLKKDEKMDLVTFRISSGAAKRAFAVIAIGLFLATAYNAIENQEQNIQEFGEMLMDLALTQQTGDNTPAENIAELLIVNQQELTANIIETRSFQNIRDKSDTDVQSFVLTMYALQDKLADPQTKEEIITQLEQSQMQNQGIIDFEYLRNTSPTIDTIADNYWLIMAFSATMFFLFFANIILGNIVGFYTAILRRASESIEGKPLWEKRKGIEVLRETPEKPRRKKRKGIEIIRE